MSPQKLKMLGTLGVRHSVSPSYVIGSLADPQPDPLR